MSLTYYPNNKIEPHCDSQYDNGSFGANACGIMLLGFLHYTFGLPIDGEDGDKVWYRVPYKLGGESASSAANKLFEVPDEELVRFRNSEDWIRPFFSGDDADFVRWVRDWQKFMEVSGGWDTDPPPR